MKALTEQQFIFWELLTALPDTNQWIAEYLDVSVPTVRRWKERKNMPHDYMLQALIAAVKELHGEESTR